MDDRALLLGLARYEDSLCPGGGHTIAEGWHSDMDGWWEADEFVCHACTARSVTGKPVTYTLLRNTLPATKPLTPFDINKTVSRP